ncbi:MAG: orotidine-5'-phosphate decarboxylase [Bacteroidetes bacterium]|jgi:orotidine-5'-phosphate decarboxylase|nr:orotidine-5'-phosphate decarboxylase [Bacteroidota bacterium]
MIFTKKLQRAVNSSNSILSVGLDPDPVIIPRPLKQQFSDTHDQVFEFCRRVIEATKTDVVAYKPNLAFFEALGVGGWRVLEALMDTIPAAKITIADAKRGDIGSTSEMYKRTFFDQLQADAVTLNPLMGLDTLDPYLQDETKAVFVLAMTSNKGAADFLRTPVMGRRSLGEYIAELLQKKQTSSQTHIGMVVGATQTDIAGQILRVNGNSHLLIPGIGAQGGRVEDLQGVLSGHDGIPIVNSSRSIIYAGGDEENWEELVQKKAAETCQSLHSIAKHYIQTKV